MCKLDVVEKLAVFIRFKGCNLACEYCDTQWANQADAPAQQMTAEEIVDYVISTGVKNVTLTGGEPLLRDGIEDVIDSVTKAVKEGL